MRAEPGVVHFTAADDYAAGTPRYNWTAAASDGAWATGNPWVVAGTHEPACPSARPFSSGGDAGTPVAIATAVTPPTTVTYSAGSQLNVRMQVTGTNPTTVRLKVWPATQPEPTAWLSTATDTFAALQNPGAVGRTGYIPSGVTNTPVVLRFSALTARPT